MVGRAAAQQRAGVVGDLGADLLAQLAQRLLAGRPVARSARGSAGRHPRGSDQATSGDSSSPPAISSEPPPMSKTARRPEDQPNQRRTARKVSRASSSPGSTLIVDAGALLDVARARRRSCRRRGPPRWRRSRSPRSPCPRRASSAWPTNSVSASTPSSADGAVLVEVLGQPQLLLVARTPASARRRGRRPRRAGGPCWSRCRAHRGACPHGYRRGMPRAHRRR